MEPDPPALQPVDPLLLQSFVLPLLSQLRAWRGEAAAGGRRLPLIGLNGPVGAGKTTLGRQLEALAPRFGLRLVVASIDDVYLGWPERGERLAGNPFGVSRVPPGSHDLPLLLAALESWRQTGVLRLPRFDKTLAAGQGDRAGWREQACDALVLEGWLMGCRPLADSRLAALMETLPASGGQAQADAPLGLPEEPLRSGCGAPPPRPEEWRWLPLWNRELEAYEPLWHACDGLWLLRPLHWGLPRRWRFQAEARQRRTGGGWLPAAELDQLVRASLCSLPPALYQDPLARELAGEAERFFGPTTADGRSVAAAGQGVATHGVSNQLAASSAAPGKEPSRAELPLAEPNPGDDPSARAGRVDAEAAISEATDCLQARPTAGAFMPWGNTPAGNDVQPLNTERPPVQAVAWLDGRRRCQSVWLQPSLSPSSSATG